MKTLQWPSGQEVSRQVLENPDQVAEEACCRILATAKDALAQRGRFRLVLAGGRTPEQTYRLLAKADTDWRRWEIWFTDERCLPRDDPERNSVMARRAWLDRVSLKTENVHPIPAELGAMDASRLYTSLLATALPFDLVLLGLGEDGHTASLFPGHPHAGPDLAFPVFSAPKPPAERVTLSAGALGQTRRLLVLVCGAEKKQALAAWELGEDLPISRIRPPGPVEVLADRCAAGTREDC